MTDRDAFLRRRSVAPEVAAPRGSVSFVGYPVLMIWTRRRRGHTLDLDSLRHRFAVSIPQCVMTQPSTGGTTSSLMSGAAHRWLQPPPSPEASGRRGRKAREGAEGDVSSVGCCCARIRSLSEPRPFICRVLVSGALA